MKKFLITIFLALIATVATLCYMLYDSKKEVKRLSSNQRSLLSDIELYRTKDSLSVASIERLELSRKEFERYCNDLKMQCSELKIKISRLQSVSQTGVTTNYPIYVPVTEKVFERDTLYCVNYQDNYLTIDGCATAGIFSGQIKSTDTLTIINHIIPKQFLFIKWGVKQKQTEVLCKNPYSTISSVTVIDIKK